MARGALLVAVVVFAMACETNSAHPPTVSILSSGTPLVDVPVITATTAAERMAGLGAYPNLPLTVGLVLVFPVEGQVCLTNEPVSYAIDAILANELGEEVGRRCGWPAGSPDVQCWNDVKYVLEMHGGMLCAYGTEIELAGLDEF